jgi:hypothetical protein
MIWSSEIANPVQEAETFVSVRIREQRAEGKNIIK